MPAVKHPYAKSGTLKSTASLLSVCALSIGLLAGAGEAAADNCYIMVHGHGTQGNVKSGSNQPALTYWKEANFSQYQGSSFLMTSSLRGTITPSSATIPLMPADTPTGEMKPPVRLLAKSSTSSKAMATAIHTLSPAPSVRPTTTSGS